MRSVCHAGNGASVDTLLQHIDSKQGYRPAIRVVPEPRPFLRSPTTTGTDILEVLEFRLKRRIDCRTCRNSILKLNQIKMSHDDIVIMLNGHIGGSQELRPCSTVEISKCIHPIVPREPDPFSGQPIIHFGAHLWPVNGNWRWHVKLWNRMVELTNGRCFIGISVDDNTDPVSEVVGTIDSRIDVEVFQNTREGENHTFRWLQSVVPQGQDDVLNYCHGKGVQDHTFRSPAVRRWTESMYETVTFNLPMIAQKLADGYDVCMSHRYYGQTPLRTKYRWIPSGTFFAVRAKHLSGKPVRPVYGGTEAWCGDNIRPHRAWCEFGDPMPCPLYNEEASKATLVPLLEKWRSSASNTSLYQRVQQVIDNKAVVRTGGES